ncbi:unnamed protein product, partial [Brachionus calyciflorus]
MNIHNLILTFFMAVSVLLKECLSCGISSISNSNGRIMNGENAIPNSWPWMASIRHIIISSGKKNHYHICGGSLISRNFVLTAAHCVDGYSIEVLSVSIGSNYLDEINQTYYSISEIFVHPEYVIFPKKNDIALVKLSKSLTLKENISPICLPTSLDVSIIFNQNVVVLGWGSTNGENSRSQISNTLLQATLKIQNEATPSICKGHESYVYCALDPTKKKSNICFGDSGGPLMFFKDEKWYLYGASSFVFIYPDNFTCMNTEASFFAMIPNFLNWITNITKSSESSSTTTKAVTPSIHLSGRKCGYLPSKKKLKKANRIIFGNPTAKNSWPWMVSIRQNGRDHICGGTLISSNHIITAAHCVYDSKPENLLIVAGVKKLNAVLKKENKFKVADIYIHPNFNSIYLNDDIAMLKLDRTIEPNQKIDFICLPPNRTTNIIHDKNVIIVGWGNSNGSFKASFSNNLLQATMRVLNFQKDNNCKNYDSLYYCALGSGRKPANICFGDAGGPLMFQLDDNNWYLYGTASFVSVHEIFNIHSNQFGYRKNSSCKQAHFLVNETINYYRQGESKVHLVKINRQTIDNVFISEGVKQGVILSLYLFNSFINDLIKNCTEKNIGAKINNIQIPIIAYCDDIILIAPSFSHCRILISECEDFANNWKLEFNASKSVAVTFFKSKVNFDSKFILNGKIVPNVSGFIYLGLPIGNQSYINEFLENKWKSVEKALYSLYGLGCKSKMLNPFLVSFLFKTYSQSIFRYVLDNFLITESKLKELDKTYLLN